MVRPTSTSLLLRLQDLGNQDAWHEFERDYRELLVRFCRRRGLQAPDAEDVVQSLLLDLTRHLPKFTLDRSRGRFRDFLFRCTANAIARWRTRHGREMVGIDTSLSSNLGDEGLDAAAAQAWEREWVDHHYRLALRSVRLDFDLRSIEIFERCVEGMAPEEVARSYETSVEAVYKVRQRIRARMQELVQSQIRAEEAFDDRRE